MLCIWSNPNGTILGDDTFNQPGFTKEIKMLDNQMLEKIENHIDKNQDKVNARIDKLVALFDANDVHPSKTTFAAFYQMLDEGVDIADKNVTFESIFGRTDYGDVAYDDPWDESTDVAKDNCCPDVYDEIEDFAQKNPEKVEQRLQVIAELLDKNGINATRTTLAALLDLAAMWEDKGDNHVPTFKEKLGL